MNQIREIQKINDEELARGMAGTPASWHAKYSQSAWCFVGNLDHKLVEGDVIAVLSEYGEIDDVHLVREEDTGKSKGFAFCKYEDARSCVLAVDNLCGVSLLGRSLRIDHVENYRLPKSLQEKEEELQKRLLEKGGLEGAAYDDVELANDYSLQQGQDLFAKPPPTSTKKDGRKNEDDDRESEKRRKRKQEKEEKRQEKERRRRERDRIRMERDERRREKRARKIEAPEGDDSSVDDRKHRDKERKKESKKDSMKDSRREPKKSVKKEKKRKRSE